MRPVHRFCLQKITPNHPVICIDVGAYGGIQQKWAPILSAMKVIAFDPDERAALKNDENVQYHPFILHRTSENLKFYITEKPGLSSIFKPNANLLSEFEDGDRFAVRREEMFPASKVTSLDLFLNAHHIPDVDMMKLDTQGSELSVLEGGEKFALTKAFAIQVEVEFTPLYLGQPLFRDVDRFLGERSYVLMDLRRSYWKRKVFYDYAGKGALVHGDALYFKDLGCFKKEINLIADRSVRAAKIWKSILICSIYHMFDYAVAVARIGLTTNSISQNEHDDLVILIKKTSRPVFVGRLPGYTRFHNAMTTILQKLRPQSYLGWADCDRDIANIRDV